MVTGTGGRPSRSPSPSLVSTAPSGRSCRDLAKQKGKQGPQESEQRARVTEPLSRGPVSKSRPLVPTSALEEQRRGGKRPHDLPSEQDPPGRGLPMVGPRLVAFSRAGWWPGWWPRWPPCRGTGKGGLVTGGCPGSQRKARPVLTQTLGLSTGSRVIFIYFLH